AGGAHPTRGAGGDDLRDRQSTEPRRRADHHTRRARAPGRAQPECGQTCQSLDGLRLSPPLSGRWGGIGGRRRGERRPELMFALEVHRAECEFLTGALAAAEARLTMLSSRAATTVERATVACLRMDACTTLGQSGRAVDVCLDYLQHVGMHWSPHPTEEEARREYERVWSLLGSREIEELLDLPLMSDPVALATLEVLTKVVPAALLAGNENLYSLAICRAVNLSLEHGNTDASCGAYVALGGLIAGPHFGDYQAGYRFGQLGYGLVERRGF